MFWIVIFLAMAAVVGVSVVVGITRPVESRGQSRFQRRPLSNREKLELAKVAGVLPARKEN